MGRWPPWLLKSSDCRKIFVFLIFRLPVFDTTPPGVGDRLKPRICTSRESHPSEDLSELPPLLVAVAGQEYLALTRSLRNSLSCCFVDGRVPLAALMASFMRINRTGGSWRIFQCRFAPVWRFVRERISVAGYDRVGPVFFKVRRVGKEKPPHCVGSEKAKNISKIQKKFIFVKSDGKRASILVIITCFFRRFAEFWE